MFDLGDTVDLTWAGQPAAGQLTVTLPDGSTLGPFTVAQGASYPFVTTIAGRHVAHWVTTTGEIQAYSDAFDVAGADPGFVISLGDVKAQLDISSSSSDDELRMWLGATTDVVEHFVGSVAPRTYSEIHDGGGFSIITYHAPIISVQSLTEYLGAATYPLTNQPVGQATDAYGFSIDNPAGGVISRRWSSSLPFRFMPGSGNVAITYKAGRVQVPFAVQAAARIIIQHLWQTRRGAMPLPGPGGDTVLAAGFGFAVPARAVELLQNAQRTASIA